MILFLLNDISNEITFRSISRSLGIKSETTVKKYVTYASETYLVFIVERYSRKIKTYPSSPKKLYCVDNGLLRIYTDNFIEKNGRLLENMVAVHLKRNQYDFYYYRKVDKTEVDFVLPDQNFAIQVCYVLNDGNERREIKGLMKVSDDLGIDNLLIITKSQEKSLQINGHYINIIPAWKFVIFDLNHFRNNI